MMVKGGNRPAIPEMSGYLPATMEGFTPSGPDSFFTADTLFDLIDGGAEIYRALNVRHTVHRRYSHPEANDIIVDIFDMGSADDAYGAYHNDIREGGSAGIGRESEYQGGSLNFWKDRYYVSVVALHETELTARAVPGIGRAVADAIPGDAPPPALTRYLPREGQLTEQVYFFHDHQGLARRYRLKEGNPLLLGKETDGLLARFRVPSGEGDAFVLLLLRYPSTGAARTAHRSVRVSLAPEWDKDEAVRSPGGGWISSFHYDDIVAVVLDAPTRKSAAGLINTVRSLTPAPER